MDIFYFKTSQFKNLVKFIDVKDICLYAFCALKSTAKFIQNLLKCFFICPLPRFPHSWCATINASLISFNNQQIYFQFFRRLLVQSLRLEVKSLFWKMAFLILVLFSFLSILLQYLCSLNSLFSDLGICYRNEVVIIVAYWLFLLLFQLNSIREPSALLFPSDSLVLLH